MPTGKGYPVQLLLEGVPVLVVGGGSVAARKAAGLAEVGALVTLVAPEVSPEAARLPVNIERRRYRSGEAAHYRLVFTAVDDPAVTAAVAADASRANVFLNAADDPAHCSFTLPAVARSGDITVAVATDGRAPLLARALRDRFATLLDDDLVRLVAAVSDVRRHAHATGTSTENLDWRAILGVAPDQAVASGGAASVVDRLSSVPQG